jgi:peptidoglycan/LPS O-acetylase OafA/YrhL
MGPFFIGMLLAVVNAEYGDRIRRSFHKRPLLETATVAAGLVLLWLATSVPMHDPAAPFNGSEFNPWANFLYLSTHRSVLTLGVTLLLIAAFHGAFAGRWVNRFFSARIWYPFAQLIYPIYLFHFPFIVVAAVIVFRTTDRSTIHDVGMPEVFGIFAIALLLTFLFSILVHLFIERPAINIRG